MFVRFQIWNKFEYFLKKILFNDSIFPIFPFLQYKNGTININKSLSANVVLIHSLCKS